MARGRRTDYEWARLQIGTAGAATATKQLLGQIDFNAAGTVYRQRVRLKAFLAGEPGADLAKIIHVGAVKVTTDAATAGVASLPEVVGDAQLPWLWRTALLIGSVDAGANSQASTDTVEVDSKAMRRFKMGETIVIVADPVDITGAGTWTIVGFVDSLAGA